MWQDILDSKQTGRFADIVKAKVKILLRYP